MGRPAASVLYDRSRVDLKAMRRERRRIRRRREKRRGGRGKGDGTNRTIDNDNDNDDDNTGDDDEEQRLDKAALSSLCIVPREEAKDDDGGCDDDEQSLAAFIAGVRDGDQYLQRSGESKSSSSGGGSSGGDSASASARGGGGEDVVGSIADEVAEFLWPMLRYHADDRTTAEEALRHPFLVVEEESREGRVGRDEL